MSDSLTIALDTMGGDHAPAVVLRGADIALLRYPGVRFLLFGDEARVAPLLARLPRLAKAATLHHTDEVVADDTKPSQALRAARRSSMRLAIEAVAEGRADGVVSAGNTGALMAIAKFVLKTLPFARTVLGLVQPTVGLLNVGSEDLKGNDAVRAAGAQLRGGMTPIRFHGFIEGDDIAAGTVDVVVTDGFTGNVALKTAEGIAKLFGESLRASFRHSVLARIGYLFARGALKKLAARLDPRRYNGAMFLGLGGIAVKSHGSTDAFGFANAIGVAIDLKVNGFLDKIRADLAQLNKVPAPQQSAAL